VVHLAGDDLWRRRECQLFNGSFNVRHGLIAVGDQRRQRLLPYLAELSDQAESFGEVRPDASIALSRTSPNGCARPPSKVRRTPPRAVTAWNRRRRRSSSERRRRSAEVDRRRSAKRSNSTSKSPAAVVRRAASWTAVLPTETARLEHRKDANINRISAETDVDLENNDLPVPGRLPAALSYHRRTKVSVLCTVELRQVLPSRYLCGTILVISSAQTLVVFQQH